MGGIAQVWDYLKTHRPKRDHWIKRHPKVHFHFTPTHASWLNQIEIWFSLLSHYALRGASFTRIRQLRQAIDDFISVHNEKATPFEWTKRYVKSVHPLTGTEIVVLPLDILLLSQNVTLSNPRAI